jgi:succinate dehydrogenase / fumarate reductase cytochrome b subunit
VNKTFADRYQSTVGMLAWIFHRLSGLLLTVYVLYHIYYLRAAQQSAQSFNQVLQETQTPFWRFINLLILLALLFHTFNGIRLLAFDTGRGLRIQRQLFWAAFVLTIAIFLFSAIMVFTYMPPSVVAR